MTSDAEEAAPQRSHATLQAWGKSAVSEGLGGGNIEVASSVRGLAGKLVNFPLAVGAWRGSAPPLVEVGRVRQTLA